MTGYTKLIAPIEREDGLELLNLARRWSTTAKMLGQLAVRQLFVAARAEQLPELPALDPSTTAGTYVWLNQTDRATLDALAEGQGMTPEGLASLALRHMLAKARNGALPMMKPTEEAPPAEPISWEELLARKNRWDAERLDKSDDLPTEKPFRPARVNFSKALFTIERLERLHNEGIDPTNPRAALNDIAALVSVPPPA